MCDSEAVNNSLVPIIAPRRMRPNVCREELACPILSGSSGPYRLVGLCIDVNDIVLLYFQRLSSVFILFYL